MIVLLLFSFLSASSIDYLLCDNISTHIVSDLNDGEEKEGEKQEKEAKEDVEEEMIDRFYRAKRAGLNLSQDRLLAVIIKCLHHPEVPTPPPDCGVTLS